MLDLLSGIKVGPSAFSSAASRPLFSREIELIETNLPGAWAFRSTQRAKSRWYLKLIILSKFLENTLYQIPFDTQGQIKGLVSIPTDNKIYFDLLHICSGVWCIKWYVLYWILTYFWLYLHVLKSAHCTVSTFRLSFTLCIWFLKKAKIQSLEKLGKCFDNR